MANKLYDAMFKKIQEEAQSVGAGAQKIDPAYVQSRLDNTTAQYGQGIIDANKPQVNPVVQAMTGGQTTTSVVPQKSNISDMIKEGSKAQTDSILSQIRQRIAESKANQQGLIKQAGQQYDPLRAQSEVAKSQQLRSVLEQSANMGDRGGIGRQEALATQTEGENRLNQINLQQQNFVDSANAEIARLENEGKYQEAQAIYDQKAKELDALMNESVRQEGLASNREEQVKADFINTITRFASDYQKQINAVKNDNDPSNDWQVPYLEQARQGKLGDIAKGQSEQQSALYKMAMDKWESGIPVNSQEAQALGVRVGSTKPVKQSGGGGSTATKPISDTFAIAGLEEIANRYPPVKSTGLVGAFEKSNRERQLANEYQNYFQQLADSGYPERELRLLAARYGIQLGGTEQIQDSSTRMTN